MVGANAIVAINNMRNDDTGLVAAGVLAAFVLFFVGWALIAAVKFFKNR